MNLLEHIKNRANLTKENFNFSSGMNKLFTSEFQGIRNIPELPIEVETTTWEEVSDFYKTSFVRSFVFKNHKHLRFFVSEILECSSKMHHYPLMSIDSSKVVIELYTQGINDISELDLKLSKFIDEIYEDVKFIQEF